MRPVHERPRRRVPDGGQLAEADVLEDRAQVQRRVWAVARAHQIAGGHEDARVVGVPEERSQDELQDDAQREDAPVVAESRLRCRHARPAASRRWRRRPTPRARSPAGTRRRRPASSPCSGSRSRLWPRAGSPRITMNSPSTTPTRPVAACTVVSAWSQLPRFPGRSGST